MFDYNGEGIGDGAPLLCLIRRALGDTTSACFGIEGQGRAVDPGAHIVQAVLLIGCVVAAAVVLGMATKRFMGQPIPR
jgi:hypothetical protein